MASSFTKKLDAFGKSLAFLDTANFAVAAADLMYRSGVLTEFGRTFEMGWKALKGAFEVVPGEKTVSGSPRSVIQTAAHLGWITDEAVWLDMLQSRSESIHRYDANLAAPLSGQIETRYLPALHNLLSRLTAIAEDLYA